MGIVLDIVILLIIVVFVIIGLRKGFVATAANFIGSIIAAILSSVLGGKIAQWLFDTMFRASLIEKINASIGDSVTAGGDASSFLSTLPDFILRALENAGITENSINSGIQSSQLQIAEAITNTLEPALVGFIKIFAVIILFMVFMFIVRILANFLNGIFSLPVLGSLNSLLGILFGILRAMILIWIVLVLVYAFIPMLSIDMQSQVNTVVEGSILVKFFVNLNPFKSLL